jgi:hypothetical protein
MLVKVLMLKKDINFLKRLRIQDIITRKKVVAIPINNKIMYEAQEALSNSLYTVFLTEEILNSSCINN